MRQQHGFDPASADLVPNPVFNADRGSSAAGGASASALCGPFLARPEHSTPSEGRPSTGRSDAGPGGAGDLFPNGSLVFGRDASAAGEEVTSWGGLGRSRGLQKTASLHAFRRLQSRKREDSCASITSTVAELDDEDDAGASGPLGGGDADACNSFARLSPALEPIASAEIRELNDESTNGAANGGTNGRTAADL